MASLEWVFEFPARYEVIPHDRIPDGFPRPRVFSYPDATRVDEQRQFSDGPILEIRPPRADPWIGLFEGRVDGWGPGDFGPPYLVGWPDETSLCVVWSGLGTLVPSEDPTSPIEIECWPVKDLLVVPEPRLVVFVDHEDVVAYGSRGIEWKTDGLVTDELQIVRAEGDTLHLRGFHHGRRSAPLSIDLRTGEPTARAGDDPIASARGALRGVIDSSRLRARARADEAAAERRRRP